MATIWLECLQWRRCAKIHGRQDRLQRVAQLVVGAVGQRSLAVLHHQRGAGALRVGGGGPLLVGRLRVQRGSASAVRDSGGARGARGRRSAGMLTRLRGRPVDHLQLLLGTVLVVHEMGTG